MAREVTLSQAGENHVVVMDNATFHKGRRTQELIENTGATLLYLPPYSPNLNPIEHDRLVTSLAALKKRREYNEHLTLDEISKHISNHVLGYNLYRKTSLIRSNCFLTFLPDNPQAFWRKLH